MDFKFEKYSDTSSQETSPKTDSGYTSFLQDIDPLLASLSTFSINDQAYDPFKAILEDLEPVQVPFTNVAFPSPSPTTLSTFPSPPRQLNDFPLFAQEVPSPVKSFPKLLDKPSLDLSFDPIIDAVKVVTAPVGAERKSGTIPTPRKRETTISTNPTFHHLEEMIGETLDEPLHLRKDSGQSEGTTLSFSPQLDISGLSLDITSPGQVLQSLDRLLPTSPLENTLWDPLVAIPESLKSSPKGDLSFQEFELPESERRRLASVNLLRRLESPREGWNGHGRSKTQELGIPWGPPPAPRGPDIKNKKAELYKTELCRSWEDTGTCRYGSKCQFAHGEAELRPVQRHPRYKTELCKTFWETGDCPYGKRCCFVHTFRDLSKKEDDLAKNLIILKKPQLRLEDEVDNETYTFEDLMNQGLDLNI